MVVGDVHGCSEELRALVDDVRPGQVVLVGDLFTKGPDPVGVWDQVLAGGFLGVLGNHDTRLLAAIDGARPKDRHAAEVIGLLDAAHPGWSEDLRGWPLFVEVAGWTVVHAGIHPSGSLDLTDARMAVTMRRWPLEGRNNPHWHAIYTGDRRVCFGHDAVGGLVRVERDGAPLLIGLDSGCVYGGALSGYVIEEDRVVSIPAARAYQTPGPPRESPPGAP